MSERLPKNTTLKRYPFSEDGLLKILEQASSGIKPDKRDYLDLLVSGEYERYNVRRLPKKRNG